jgi:DNA-binding CsgD family transcriptional regulator
VQGQQIVGRDPELAALADFLAGTEPRALVLTGGPGIGKTTLWAAAIASTHRRVLSARPSGAEARLAFAALIDLCDGVDTTLAGIPPPQRAALEVALLRAEPAGPPPEAGAIGLGFLGLLRSLAASGPLLIAIDDTQWLDPPSDEAIAFVARRVAGDSVAFLLARRPGRLSAVERAVERGALERLEVGPLSPDATRRLVTDRLDLALSRDVLQRVVEPALGNPLFALELGRALIARGPPEPAGDIPLSDALEKLLGTRVERLSGHVRTLLLAVALSGDLSMAELTAVATPAALEDALDAGLVVVDSGRVRAAHPLLAAAARKRSRRGERRELHRALAAAVDDRELRALHLALATPRPDDQLAAAVAAAAASALARGARADAVRLAEHALRLTPDRAPERTDRVLALAECLDAAGEPQRVTDLLAPALDALPAGAARVRAQLLLSEGGGVRCMADHVRHLDLALAAAGDDRVLRAHVLAKQAANTAATCVERLADAEAWALEALAEAERAGPDVERLALFALSWARSLGGRPVGDICDRFDAVSDEVAQIAYSPHSVAAQRVKWRGETELARARTTALLQLADERGEAVSYAIERLFVCELELRAGAWDAAERLLDEWSRSSDPLVPFTYMRCRAQLAAGRGLPAEAERWAAPAVAGAEEIGTPWQRLEALHARGMAALLGHEPGRATEALRTVWEHAEREGVEPGAFPVAPDLVEALMQHGEPDAARAVTSRLADVAEAQDHPWGRVTAKRCAAIVDLASGSYDEDAAAALGQAAVEYARLGLRFDVPRSLLCLGRAQRRHRKWRAARRSLEEAVDAFAELGSPGWADEARAELARVGGRPPAVSGALTPTEQRVVDLAVEGRANKEIAGVLFVTVHTVEVHLSRAYAKLGVRSRSQLAAALSRGRKGPVAS